MVCGTKLDEKWRQLWSSSLGLELPSKQSSETQPAPFSLADGHSHSTALPFPFRDTTESNKFTSSMSGQARLLPRSMGSGVVEETTYINRLQTTNQSVGKSSAPPIANDCFCIPYNANQPSGPESSNTRGIQSPGLSAILPMFSSFLCHLPPSLLQS